jgi:8-amino-7-oxononanoate synthase
MINRCRPFIFATAPSPLIAACVRAALKIIEAADERRGELMARIDFAGAEMRRLCAIEPSGSQIQPIVVGSDIRATTLAARLQAHGYDIRAIRPPTVPEGSARLRIALTLNARKEDIARMVAHLGEELARLEP